MTNVDDILARCNELINVANNVNEEMKQMNKDIEMLQNEYKTNKRYFRDEPGKVTIDDVIKTAYELGWSSHRVFVETHK